MSLFISFPEGGSSTYVNMLAVGSGDLGVSEGLNNGNELPSYPDRPVVFLNPVLKDHDKPYFALAFVL